MPCFKSMESDCNEIQLPHSVIEHDNSRIRSFSCCNVQVKSNRGYAFCDAFFKCLPANASILIDFKAESIDKLGWMCRELSLYSEKFSSGNLYLRILNNNIWPFSSLENISKHPFDKVEIETLGDWLQLLTSTARMSSNGSKSSVSFSSPYGERQRKLDERCRSNNGRKIKFSIQDLDVPLFCKIRKLHIILIPFPNLGCSLSAASRTIQGIDIWSLNVVILCSIANSNCKVSTSFFPFAALSLDSHSYGDASKDI
mmetsp:Transcript_8166/g.17743  ORF Transcript_8166/g.17743 Transcript_8166/m.17743 type:complete len:256 (-) Transcript_8166:26-793(-)